MTSKDLSNQTPDASSESISSASESPASPQNPVPPQVPPSFLEEDGNKKGFFERFAATIKLMVIGFLTLLLLIPLGMIRGLINERQSTKSITVQEITSKWSGEQIVTGPIIAIPFAQELMVKDKQEVVMKNLLIFPETLDVQNNTAVEKRKRGIYDATVYKSEILLTGAFNLKELEKAGIKASDLQFDKARVIMGITDLKGIRDTVSFKFGGMNYVMEPGIPVENLYVGESPGNYAYNSVADTQAGAPNVTTGIFATGLSVRHDSLNKDLKENEMIPFSVTLKLNGSMGLYVAPVGKVTTASFQSDWASPSFGGDFLPSSHEITDQGFTAEWKVLDLNRSYGQVIRADDNSAINQVTSSLFGVKFIQSVDQYQQNFRSVKYGVLIILLTFVTVLFIELIRKKKVNPFHYLLVGLALVLFYALLLSMSEIWGFNLAYSVAALMTILMITLHIGAILKDRKQGSLVGSLLAFLYLFVFLLIQMESYSLLVGSLGLFAILAVIMYFARRIKM